MRVFLVTIRTNMMVADIEIIAIFQPVTKTSHASDGKAF